MRPAEPSHLCPIQLPPPPCPSQRTHPNVACKRRRWPRVWGTAARWSPSSFRPMTARSSVSAPTVSCWYGTSTPRARVLARVRVLGACGCLGSLQSAARALGLLSLLAWAHSLSERGVSGVSLLGAGSTSVVPKGKNNPEVGSRFFAFRISIGIGVCWLCLCGNGQDWWCSRPPPWVPWPCRSQ